MSSAIPAPSPPEAVDGRDVELVVVGLLCFVLAGWTAVAVGLRQPVPLALFLGLGALSFALAYWDLQRRDVPLARRIRRSLSR